MKNVLYIDSKTTCTCTLVTSVDDKSASLFLNITVDKTLNPRLEIKNGRTVTLTAATTEIQLTQAEITGTGNLQFRIVDNNKTGDYFTVAKLAAVDDSLYITQESNFNYTLRLKGAKYDTALSTTSENAVQNKVVTSAINTISNKSDEIEGSISDVVSGCTVTNLQLYAKGNFVICNFAVQFSTAPATWTDVFKLSFHPKTNVCGLMNNISTKADPIGVMLHSSGGVRMTDAPTVNKVYAGSFCFYKS